MHCVAWERRHLEHFADFQISLRMLKKNPGLYQEKEAKFAKWDGVWEIMPTKVGRAGCASYKIVLDRILQKEAVSLDAVCGSTYKGDTICDACGSEFW